MSEFGETLARYRDEAGLNQRELGAAIGLDHTQLNKIERGHRPPLGAKYVKPLVRALRLSRSEAKHLVVDLAGLSPKVLDFMDEKGDDKAVTSKQQAGSTSLPTMAHAAIAPSALLHGATGGQIERLIAAARLTEEEEDEVSAALIEMTQRLLSIIETQRKMRKED
jgi:transcriptional regulator with XRE-family HTH domain